MGQENKEHIWNLIAKKLAGEASPEELRELELLLRNNPDLHYPLQTIDDLWKPADTRDRQAADQAFGRHLERMEALQVDYMPAPADAAPASPSSGSRRNKVLALSALCLCLALAGAWFYREQTGKPSAAANAEANALATTRTTSEVFTRNGSRTNLLLPDGTQVWMNAGSHIAYDKNFGINSRELTLTGEAFFDVTHNASKPFIIHTARMDVKVLGTRFNVRSYTTDKTTEATLIRGSIEVSIKDRSSEKIILKPNEKLVVADDDSVTLHSNRSRSVTSEPTEPLVSIQHPTYKRTTGEIVETSWVDNKLVFQDEEFKTLAKDMERWYGVSIQFNNPQLENLWFTGSFQNETIQQALDALKISNNSFNYTIHQNNITIYDK